MLAKRVLFLLTASATVWAANPHFINISTSVLDEGTLRVEFKEVGLTGQQIEVVLTADAAATYQCFSKGNQPTLGSPYDTSAQAVSAQANLFVGKNGQVTASLDINPPSAQPAEAVLKCLATNKRLCLVGISYTKIVLTDTTNFASASGPDVERSFPAPTKQLPNPSTCISSL